MTSEAKGSVARILSPLRLAPFGQHTRYLLRTHLRHAAIVASALLSLALTIDMVPQVSHVMAKSSGSSAAGRVALLVVLRAADLLPRFLPLAIFFAVVWTEIVHTVSRERVLVLNTGRTPALSLSAAIWLGLLLLPVQFISDAYLRPLAMHVQIANRLGTHGELFDRSQATKTNWIAIGHDLVRAKIVYSPGILRDLSIYRLDHDGHLREVDSAQAAFPNPEGTAWTLLHGQYWIVPAPAMMGSRAVQLFTSAAPTDAVQFEERLMDLNLDPLWVKNFGIYVEYLTQDTLRAMSRRTHEPGYDSLIRTRIDFNRANAVMPLAMALFASVVAGLVFPYRVTFLPAFLVVLGGYAIHLLMRTLTVMGEHAYVSPLTAAWFTPLALVAVSGILLFNSERRRPDAPEFLKKFPWPTPTRTPSLDVEDKAA